MDLNAAAPGERLPILERYVLSENAELTGRIFMAKFQMTLATIHLALNADHGSN
jgi:hypothetical protein